MTSQKLGGFFSELVNRGIYQVPEYLQPAWNDLQQAGWEEIPSDPDPQNPNNFGWGYQKNEDAGGCRIFVNTEGNGK